MTVTLFDPRDPRWKRCLVGCRPAAGMHHSDCLNARDTGGGDETFTGSEMALRAPLDGAVPAPSAPRVVRAGVDLREVWEADRSAEAGSTDASPVEIEKARIAALEEIAWAVERQYDKGNLDPSDEVYEALYKLFDLREKLGYRGGSHGV